MYSGPMMTKHNHPLFKWSRETGRKLQWLAEEAGISKGALTQYIHYRHEAPKPVRLAFETITGGAVRHDQWGIDAAQE